MIKNISVVIFPVIDDHQYFLIGTTVISNFFEKYTGSICYVAFYISTDQFITYSKYLKKYKIKLY